MSVQSRQIHLNAFLMSSGHHEAAWRLPESKPLDTVSIEHYVKLARIAEAGTFDSVFFADSPEDVEGAKAMCRGCRARIACLAGALERSEPWGVWGGELLMCGAIIPHASQSPLSV